MKDTSVIEIIGELIATASVNPRLAAACDQQGGEAAMTNWLTVFATAQGWRWMLQEVHPGRSNFIAIVPGDRGEALLWEAHQDTVSGQGMSLPPYAAEKRNGRIYGRGACDVKGGMAAMLAALVRVHEESQRDRPNIILACTVNEECGFTGAVRLADIWRNGGEGEATVASEIGGLTMDELRALRPAAAIVAEPTELNVVMAHRGVVRWQCEVHGRAVHSSRPEEGANAVYAIARVVRLIEDYHRNELSARTTDPLCGPPTACVTTIRGGTGPNTVPDFAVIDIDRRLRPDESLEDAYRELIDFLAERTELGECRLHHQPPWMQSRGLAADANRALAERLIATAKSRGVASRAVGVPYGTNAASIAAAGIPAVVFGPGSIAQAHTADEWISIDELQRAVDVFTEVARGGLAVNSAEC